MMAEKGALECTQQSEMSKLTEVCVYILWWHGACEDQYFTTETG